MYRLENKCPWIRDVKEIVSFIQWGEYTPLREWGVYMMIWNGPLQYQLHEVKNFCPFWSPLLHLIEQCFPPNSCSINNSMSEYYSVRQNKVLNSVCRSFPGMFLNEWMYLCVHVCRKQWFCPRRGLEGWRWGSVCVGWLVGWLFATYRTICMY